MASPLNVRDMDEIGFQRKEWTVQRIGWVVMALFIVAAFIGVFSVGPLSETAASSSDGAITVEYDRFVRHVGTTTMTIVLGEAAVDGEKATVFVSRELTEGWRIQSIDPQPSTASSSKADLIWEFDVLGETPPVIEVLYRGGGIGLRDGAIRAGQTDGVELWQLTYP